MAERARDWALKYKLSVDEVLRMLAEQHGQCAICSTPLDVGEFRVDHCHRTNQVRGLLCNDCNWAIGFLQDDPQRMRAAASYVERFK